MGALLGNFRNTLILSLLLSLVFIFAYGAQTAGGATTSPSGRR
jgi:hypothetical protein